MDEISHFQGGSSQLREKGTPVFTLCKRNTLDLDIAPSTGFWFFGALLDQSQGLNPSRSPNFEFSRDFVVSLVSRHFCTLVLLSPPSRGMVYLDVIHCLE